MAFKINPLTGFLDLVNTAGGGGTITGVIPTDSIDFTVSGTQITGDVNVSSAPADSNNSLVNLSIQPDGLKAEIPNASIQNAALNLQGPVTLLDNNSGNAIVYSKTNSFTIVEYSISRNGNLELGRFLVVTDGTTCSHADSGFVAQGSTGVSLGAVVSGSNINITYTTTNTGFAATFKYSLKQWS